MGLVDAILSAMEKPEVQDQIKNDPTAMDYYNIVRSGDQNRGEAAAMDIINKLGISKEQAIQQAQQGLQQMFAGGFRRR